MGLESPLQLLNRTGWFYADLAMFRYRSQVCRQVLGTVVSVRWLSLQALHQYSIDITGYVMPNFTWSDDLVVADRVHDLQR